jgi:hypothetical protein
MDIHNEFIAQEKALVFYAGKAILNKVHRFWDVNGDPWDFSDASNFTFKIWEEREGGRLMIDWDDVNLTLNATDTNEIILNAPAVDTSIERGKYYYEMEYIINAYPVLIAYGEANFL